MSLAGILSRALAFYLLNLDSKVLLVFMRLSRWDVLLGRGILLAKSVTIVET